MYSNVLVALYSNAKCTLQVSILKLRHATKSLSSQSTVSLSVPFCLLPIDWLENEFHDSLRMVNSCDFCHHLNDLFLKFELRLA